MENQFDKLSAEDKELLLKAPALISVLATSGNHKISKSEKADAIKTAHIKTFTADPLLLNYYQQVETSFVNHFEEIEKKYAPFDKPKLEALKEEINTVNKVISKLDIEFSKTLHKSLSEFAEHVKKLERNILVDFIFPFPLQGLTD